MENILDVLLEEMRKEKGTDLHLYVDKYPFLRRSSDGLLYPIETVGILDRNAFERILSKVMKSESSFVKLLEKEEIDITYEDKRYGRYRVNVGLARLEPFAVFRELRFNIPTPSQLKIPNEFVDVINSANYGLALVGGTTGSGKSTTLASVLNFILKDKREKVVTIEDPVEYLLGQEEGFKGYVIQREVGKDTQSFANALRSAMRQDPDYIIVGEVRDVETARNCIIASETGHVVFATIHVKDCLTAIERYAGVFQIEEQVLIRTRLIDNLIAVLVQFLLPAKKGGRVLATEFLRVDDSIRELLYERKYKEVRDLISDRKNGYGWSLNENLKFLYEKNEIDENVYNEYKREK